MNGLVTNSILWPGALWGNLSDLESAWLIFTVILWAVASVFAYATLANNGRLLRFWVFWVLSMTGNIVLIIAQDALGFYIGFSMMSLSAYGLIVHDQSPQARRAGRLYLQLAIVGEMALFAALLLMAYANDGSTSLTDWQTGVGITPVAAALLLVGLGLKAGFWPLHVWLPLAHPAAPAAASAVLSGAMIKAGILGLWKIMPLSGLSQQWAPVIMAIALFSAFYGVLMGLARSEIKQVLAYSSVSQIGYLLFLVALSWQLPAQRDVIAVALAVYAFHHALIKGALFMAAPLLKQYQPDPRLRYAMWAMLIVAALSIAGLPLTSGAAAKVGLKSLLGSPELAGWRYLVLAGAVSTSLIVGRVLWLAHRLVRKTQQEHTAAVSQNPLALGVWLALGSSAIIVPWLWQPMRAALLYSVVPYNLWMSAWPVACGMAVTCWAIRRHWRVPGALQHLPPVALLISLSIKHRSNQVARPLEMPEFDTTRLRSLERRWNRITRFNPVNLSATLLLVIVLMAGILINY